MHGNKPTKNPSRKNGKENMGIKKFITFLSIVLFCSNCTNNISENHVEISLVNFGNVEDSQMKFVQSTLEENFKIDTIINFNQKLPSETYYKPRNRYRADKLIQYLKENFESEKVIGVTDQDISTTVEKYEDWGIMGLAYRPGKSCVVSTFRTFRGAKSDQHKNDRLKKVVLHEFGHTFGLPHCENSKSCLMRDANGKVSTVDEVNDFCPQCS